MLFHTLCCFKHIARSWPISTLASHFFMLTPTGWNVSKLFFFGFLPLSSCWRRNFLGKRFAFLATRKQLPSQAASLCPQTSFLFCCWPTDCSPGKLSGKEWSRRWWLTSSEVGFLPNTCVEFLTKERTPLLKNGPQNVRKSRYLCGWIRGLREWRAPASWSNRRGKETVLWHREDPVKISTLGTMSLNSYFSLVLFLCLFPTSPIQAFPELHVPVATHKRPLFQLQNTVTLGWNGANEEPFVNMEHWRKAKRSSATFVQRSPL